MKNNRDLIEARKLVREYIREMMLLEKLALKAPTEEKSKGKFIELLKWASSRVPGTGSEVKAAIEQANAGNFEPALDLLQTMFMMMGIPATATA